MLSLSRPLQSWLKRLLREELNWLTSIGSTWSTKQTKTIIIDHITVVTNQNSIELQGVSIGSRASNCSR
jgi:hypothetical protein